MSSIYMTLIPAPPDQTSPQCPWREIALEIARTPNRNKVIALIAQLTEALDTRPRCSICNQRCNLENCKTDEAGHAVHEDCFVLKLTLKRATDDHQS